jgi:hypothetical protein
MASTVTAYSCSPLDTPRSYTYSPERYIAPSDIDLPDIIESILAHSEYVQSLIEDASSDDSAHEKGDSDAENDDELRPVLRNSAPRSVSAVTPLLPRSWAASPAQAWSASSASVSPPSSAPSPHVWPEVVSLPTSPQGLAGAGAPSLVTDDASSALTDASSALTDASPVPTDAADSAPPSSLLTMSCLSDTVDEESKHRIATTFNETMQGRTAVVATVNDVVSRKFPLIHVPEGKQPGDVPTCKWLAYSLAQVYKVGIVGWRKLGEGTFGVVSEACVRRPDWQRYYDAAADTGLETGPAAQRRMCFAVNRNLLWSTAEGVPASRMLIPPSDKDAMVVLVAAKVSGIEMQDDIKSPDSNINLISTLAQAVPAASGMQRDYAEVLLDVTETSFREVLASLYANALVKEHATPHVACLYHAMITYGERVSTFNRLVRNDPGGVDAKPLDAIGVRTPLSILSLSEMSDISLHQLVQAINSCGWEYRRRGKSTATLMRTIMFQCAQAMAAMQTSLDWRHNDLHSKNVMLSFVPDDAVYTYLLPATDEFPERTVAVPTYGVCVKVIDFGRSTGDLFGPGDSGRAWAVNTLSPLQWVTHAYGSLRRLGLLANFDMALLSASMLQTLTDEDDLAVWRALTSMLLVPTSRRVVSFVEQAAQRASDGITPAFPEHSQPSMESLNTLHRIAQMNGYETVSAARHDAVPGTALAPSVFVTTVDKARLDAALSGNTLFKVLHAQAQAFVH